MIDLEVTGVAAPYWQTVETAALNEQYRDMYLPISGDATAKARHARARRAYPAGVCRICSDPDGPFDMSWTCEDCLDRLEQIERRL